MKFLVLLALSAFSAFGADFATLETEYSHGVMPAQNTKTGAWAGTCSEGSQQYAAIWLNKNVKSSSSGPYRSMTYFMNKNQRADYYYGFDQIALDSNPTLQEWLRAEAWDPIVETDLAWKNRRTLSGSPPVVVERAVRFVEDQFSRKFVMKVTRMEYTGGSAVQRYCEFDHYIGDLLQPIPPPVPHLPPPSAPLLMYTRGDGVSNRWFSVKNPHPEVSIEFAKIGTKTGSVTIRNFAIVSPDGKTAISPDFFVPADTVVTLTTASKLPFKASEISFFVEGTTSTLEFAAYAAR